MANTRKFFEKLLKLGDGGMTYFKASLWSLIKLRSGREFETFLHWLCKRDGFADETPQFPHWMLES